MRSLAERQRGFAAALLAPATTIPPGLAGPVRDERFAIYRNNVAVGLIEALRSGFPVVNRLVGEDFFGAMARAHSIASPPVSPVLLAYGEDFPDFIAAFEPATSLPWLADVARFEWLWLQAYHAADASPLPATRLRELPPEDLPNLSLTLHPSARFMRVAHPVLAIWEAHQAAEDPISIAIGDGPEHLLFVRPDMDVRISRLSRGGLALIEHLSAGACIGEAVEAALAEEAMLDVGGLFKGLFEAGIFTDFARDGM